MSNKRPIIEIDEERCTGCGNCVLTCAEGALQIVDGKAKVIGDILCDGLGACIGDCPEDALKVIEREAVDFDEAAVHKHLETFDKAAASQTGGCGCAGDAPEEPAMACGCPGTMVRTIETESAGGGDVGELRSELGQWPIKLGLLGPQAPFLKDSDLILMADCVAGSFPDLHRKLIRGHTIAMGCPKLDNLDAHIERLAEILAGAHPKSLTVAHMEVPCCHGFVYAAEEAIKKSGYAGSFSTVKIGIRGELLEREEIVTGGKRSVG